MMRVADSSPVDTTAPTEHIATLETEHPVPVVVESKIYRWRGYLLSFCGALLGVLLVACLTLLVYYTTVKKGSKIGELEGFAPTHAPGVYGTVAAPPLFSPLSPLGVVAPSKGLELAPYETICNKTINRNDCLAMFRGNHEAGDLKQWTVKAMEAAQQAVNESYILAQSMKKANQGNVALQQCIDVFADALGNVNKSIFQLVKSTNMNSGQADVQTLMSAAMTNCETCGEGIEDVGSFPGSERITGLQAKHVDTMLSIALTFVNHLSTPPTVDRYQNRRHLHVKGGSGSSFSGMIPAKIRQDFPRCC